MGELRYRPAEDRELFKGAKVLYGYVHCTNSKTCFKKYKPVEILHRINETRFKVQVEGNYRESYKNKSDFFVETYEQAN